MQVIQKRSWLSLCLVLALAGALLWAVPGWAQCRRGGNGWGGSGSGSGWGQGGNGYGNGQWGQGQNTDYNGPGYGTCPQGYGNNPQGYMGRGQGPRGGRMNQQQWDTQTNPPAATQ